MANEEYLMNPTILFLSHMERLKQIKINNYTKKIIAYKLETGDNK